MREVSSLLNWHKARRQRLRLPGLSRPISRLDDLDDVAGVFRRGQGRGAFAGEVYARPNIVVATRQEPSDKHEWLYPR